MPRWILVAIDGTGSAGLFGWRSREGHGNSRIHHFYEDFMCPSQQKHYSDGPGWLGGDQTLGIYGNAIVFLGRAFRSLLPGLVGYQNHEIFRETVSALPVLTMGPGNIISSSDTTSERFMLAREIIRASDIKICLMGYSRGGLIAINLARIMPKRVSFLGLYDAVDSDIALDGDVIRNVERTFHVRRMIQDSALVQAGYFDTGTRQRDGAYDQLHYFVNHAEIGSGSYRPPSDTPADELTIAPRYRDRVAPDIAMRRRAQMAGVPIRGRYI